jgi:hypothetical protein
MKITYRNRENETITRHITIGQKVVGIRLDSVTVESYDEMGVLLSEQGIKWAQRNLSFRLPVFVEPKESNWGSDWVDDGV